MLDDLILDIKMMMQIFTIEIFQVQLLPYYQTNCYLLIVDSRDIVIFNLQEFKLFLAFSMEFVLNSCFFVIKNLDSFDI